MNDLLQKFIQKYSGLTGQGNTDQNKGECVGLVSLWQDVLGVSHEYGNAKDLLNNANPSYFQVIQNTPDNFPGVGDIIVWDGTWGAGNGHTAIVVSADVNSFTSFEQNDHTPQDPTGACEVLTHNYNGVLGWLHFTGQLPQPAVNITGLNTYGLDLGNNASLQVVLDTWKKDADGLLVDVGLLNAADDKIKDLQKQIGELQLKSRGDDNEIITLKGQIEETAKSDKDYAVEAKEAKDIADTYTKYMDDFANAIGITENGKTDQQLHDEIIQEIYLLHQNQKTAESSIPSEELLTGWEGQFKNIIDWLVKHGLNEFLQENGLHIVDLEGNAQDDAIGDRVIAYLDDRFHRLDVLQKAEEAIGQFKQTVKKSSTLVGFVGSLLSNIKSLFVIT